ncbi:MAG: hypothetical protein ABI556_17785, partial [Gemmatimonadales bacterium]
MLLVLRLSGKWILRSGLSQMPGGRISSANLIASPRGSVQPPQVWLVAHVDSKSQTIPMIVRMLSVGISVFSYALTVVALIAIVTLQRTGVIPLMGPHDSPAMAIAWLAPFVGAVATLP